MPQPTLLTIDEDTNKLKRLQEENELLRQRLTESVKVENVLDVNPGPAPQYPQIMDDFYIIAQYVSILPVSCRKKKRRKRYLQSNTNFYT